MKKLIQGIFLSLVAITAQAQIDQTKLIKTSETFGDYTVYYNVFNSTKLTPAIADAYQLVRGNDRALVNISLVKTENSKTSLGKPAKVSGNTKNLMQQTQTLTFVEIKEGDATYYLAPFVFNNEDVLHFNIDVRTEDNSQPMSFTFSRTLYTE